MSGRAKTVVPPWRLTPHFDAFERPTTGYIKDANDDVVVDKIEQSLGRELVRWANGKVEKADAERKPVTTARDWVNVRQLIKGIEQLQATIESLKKENAELRAEAEDRENTQLEKSEQ